MFKRSRDLFLALFRDPPPKQNPYQEFVEERLTLEDFEEDTLEDYQDTNPYKDGGWGDMDWHCLRCGYVLEELPEGDNGGITWLGMRKHGYLEFRCSNENCCHRSGGLRVHHPCSYDTEPGDSYSLSYYK